MFTSGHESGSRLVSHQTEFRSFQYWDGNRQHVAPDYEIRASRPIRRPVDGISVGDQAHRSRQRGKQSVLLVGNRGWCWVAVARSSKVCPRDPTFESLKPTDLTVGPRFE